MKNIFILLIFFSFFASAQNNYYVASSGNDNNPGTIASPFKTFSKASAIGSPGDWVLFNRGDSFYGSLSVRSGTNYGSYGNGVKPVLTGFQNVSGWIQSGTNLWQAPLSSSTNLVLVNGSFAAIGKWPNGNKVYNIINSFTGGSSLTSSSITTTWTGGTVVIRKNHWILDKSPITSQSGSKINFTNPTSYNCQTGWGFFIQNIQAACDQQNEWWYSNGQLGMYSSSQPANIKASSIGTLVNVGSATNVTFREIEFQGSNTSTVNISTGNNILFEFCDFNYAGINGFTAASSAHDITLNNCTANYTNNDFILAGGSTYWSITNSQVSNTGTIAGMGNSNDGNYIAIFNIGTGSIVKNCTLTNSGYTGVDFRGSSIQILNNTVDGFCQVKDDGAGIYTYSSSANGNYGWRTVSGNTVLNGGGASAGTNTVNSDAFGIYLDNNSSEVLVTGNYAHDCGSSGIFLHGNHNVTVTKNIVYNTVTTGGYGQFLVVTDASLTDMRNVTVTNNQFVSKTSSQVAAYFSAGKSDYNQWGRFDSNYYSGNKFYAGGNTTLAGWQSKCGGEAKSTTGSPQTSPPGTDPTTVTYYSQQQSQAFTRNNCASGSTGSQVIYTVSANQYSSTISQADADAKATADINSNGQAYANANGTCSPGKQGKKKPGS